MPKSDSFFWGAATSAYQVEGGIKNDWSEAGFDAGRAADHYNLFEKDFDLAKELGHNAHRFSIEWARIEPEPGKFNLKEIEHYRKVIQALRKRGLEPFVTLWHWPIPLWLRDKGGWQSRKTISYFTRYAEKVVLEFKNDVHFWITLNEPEIYVGNSFIRGIWPPKKKSWLAGFFIGRNLIKAHCAAYKIIKKINPDAQAGIAKNNIYYEAVGWNPWNKFLKVAADYFWNFYFLNAIAKHQDFIGLNYYFHNRINWWFNKNENKKVSDTGWEIYPKGLYHVLKGLKKYNRPVYITENGLADAKDEKRTDFIRDHIAAIKKAMAESVDVRGYLHWSLIDNFEWDKGFVPRFGLIEVDYKTMERKIRPSAYIYRDIPKPKF